MIKSDPLRQVHLAFVLLTRLPLPRLPDTAFARGAQAVWAYPLVGLAVGLAGAGAGQSALLAGLPVTAAAALALAAMILLTGAMHEDGLADAADGFWGGFTPERRLQIMRDSQIGTYGVLALVVVFALRLAAVTALLGAGWTALPVAAALSRAVMPALMAALPHARGDGLSHSVGRPTVGAAGLSAVLGGAIALLVWGLGTVLLIGVAAGTTVLIAALARRKIGGQTGDVLGAAQQVSEAVLLLTCTAML